MFNFCMEEDYSSSSSETYLQDKTTNSMQEVELDSDHDSGWYILKLRSDQSDDERLSDGLVPRQSFEPLFAQLERYVSSGNIERVKQLLETNNIDLNQESIIYTGNILDTAMIRAGYSLRNKHSDAIIRLNLVELLLKHGANPNTSNDLDKIPLKKALSPRKPKPEIIQLLLNYGAQIDQDTVDIARNKKNSVELLNILRLHLPKQHPKKKPKRCLLS